MQNKDVFVANPVRIPREEKISRIDMMSEKEFRDQIVRAVFLAYGFRDGRELHGADEEGKDMMFEAEDRFGEIQIVCVQTKKGPLNMTSKASENVLTAITQLQTALVTPVTHLESKQARIPSEVYLCASGKINRRARDHIASSVKDGRVGFMDVESLIAKIDSKCPDLWYGISIDVLAHYDAIRRQVEHDAHEITASTAAASDNAFVELTFFRQSPVIKKRRGQVERDFEYEKIHAHDLLGRNGEPTLIVGDAGSGKSTALWRIAYEVVRRDGGKGIQIPVVVRARDLWTEQGTGAEFVDEVKRLAKRFSSVANLFGAEALTEGHVTVLVDGLDEIADENRRRRVYGAVIEFAEHHPKCTVIATTRPDPATQKAFAGEGAKVYRVAPISWNQVTKIVRRVLRGRPIRTTEVDALAGGAQRVLRQIKQVHGFEITPLLAAVYAEGAQHSRSDVPANITEVFGKYTELMLGRWDEAKGLGQQTQWKIKDVLLGHIAHLMHVKRKLHVEREGFGGMVREFLEQREPRLDASEIESELLERSRLLRVREDEVSFSHLLFQEYFAGRSMPEGDVAGYVDDSWWTKAIVFHYGNDPMRADSLRSVQKTVMRSEGHPIVAYRTIGLALQASYLSIRSTRLEIWMDLVSRVASLMADCVRRESEGIGFPMTEGTVYYLDLREAVPLGVLGVESVRRGVRERLVEMEAGERNELRDAREFWLVVALLEAGFISEAHEVLGGRKWKQRAYYLWVVMGAYFIERVVPMSPAKKGVARRIKAEFESLASRYINAFFKEYRTFLLEKQRGKIVEVEDGEQVSK